MHLLRFTPLLLAFLVPLAQPGVGQGGTEVLYAFSLEVQQQAPPADIGSLVQARLLFRDSSRDSPPGLVPGTPDSYLRAHSVSWRLEMIGNETEGWQTYSPPGFPSFSGTETPITLSVRPGYTVKNPYLQLRVTAVVETPSGERYEQQAMLVFFTTGIPGFSANPLGSLKLSPREIGVTSFEVKSLATVPRTFEFSLKGNDCGMDAVPPAPLTLGPREQRVVKVALRAPAATSLFGQSCMVSFNVATTDNQLNPRTVTLTTQVTGVYVDPMAVFWSIVLVLLLILLVLFLKRRKEKLEEEILGKPQKPWTIPVERVYLKHLKAKDERAWYVVRHFLMEDEYRSALLWYKSYKKGTKGERKRERLILQQEKAYAAWKAKWAKAIAKPMKKADKWDAKLQSKLDRKARKNLHSEERKWRKLTAKLEQAHAKQQKRADEKHAKVAKKARKKGLPVPKAPALALPDLPPEPELAPIPLSGHRWAKKAARWRRAMAKRQGNLEVKFEKADARRLAKVERKVQRIARKLDDPAFVEEHPLLKGSAAQKPAP